MSNITQLIARILLGQMFLLAGLSKLGEGAYAGTQAYMESVGVPGMLLPLVILLEIGAGLAVLVGWQSRMAAIALAGFTLLAALIFHFSPDDQMQMILFMKNTAISGGLLMLAAHGAGAFSLDAYLKSGRIAPSH
jgi:putative oxidoreductase